MLPEGTESTTTYSLPDLTLGLIPEVRKGATMDFQFVKPPFKHQADGLEHSKDLSEFAVLWEQGTGKTKLTIDTIQHQYLNGVIDAVLVVAPNGIETNWITDEIPSHLPQHLVHLSEMFHFQSKKSGIKTHQRALDAFFKTQKPFKWLFMSYDAFMTEAGKKTVWKYLKNNKVFYVLDESTRIKSPAAKRTISIVASGRYATSKRILTGTPVPNGPFDIYSQMRFLNEGFWKPYGLDSFAVFKTFFGIWEKKFTKDDREYDQLLDYKNLDYLYSILQKHSSRITKEDAGLNLPPKLYSKRYFDLTAEQREVYESIKTEFLAFLSSGDLVTAPLAITRLLRMHQITSGYIPTQNDEEPIHIIGKSNPRLECLKEIVTDLPHSAIVWARFQKDIDQIMELLGDEAVRYDGLVSEEERVINKQLFQEGKKKFFVGNPSVGAEGLTLIIAKTVIYYNNDFNLHKRLQSEDRAHRIGQTVPVNYIDIVGKDTVDSHIVSALRSKMDVASQITGDKVKEWI